MKLTIFAATGGIGSHGMNDALLGRRTEINNYLAVRWLGKDAATPL